MSVFRRVFVVTAALVAPAAFAAAPKPDIGNGKTVFTQQCGLCHASSKDAAGAVIGPNLAGIVGRKAGSAPGYSNYSVALKGYKVTWNAKTLDEFLANPGGKVPGTMMPIPVTDAKVRADIVAYLATLKK
jgi:cytochrome c